MQLARQRRGQIEPEPVHVHVLHPIAQAVHHQLKHLRVPHVESVAGAGEIHVKARLAGNQAVVSGIVNALEAERRPHLVAFGGVVVYHVQNDFDSGAVHGFHHGLELADLIAAVAGGGIAGFRRKEADRVVAPIIVKSALQQVRVVHEFMHRHQLHGGDS